MEEVSTNRQVTLPPRYLEAVRPIYDNTGIAEPLVRERTSHFTSTHHSAISTRYLQNTYRLHSRSSNGETCQGVYASSHDLHVQQARSSCITNKRASKQLARLESRSMSQMRVMRALGRPDCRLQRGDALFWKHTFSLARHHPHPSR